MAVLVTRPSPFGESLVQLLNRNGIKAWHTPLIQFVDGQELGEFPQKLLYLNSGDLLFVVSQQAVQYANQALSKARINWPTNIQYFAIGQATANALHQATGCPVNYPKDREISEHLLQLSELQEVNGKNALILRGNGGRELLANQLRLRGVDVTFCECYQRQIIDYSQTELFAVWQEQRINTLVITSAEMLQRIYALVEEKNKSWLLNCRLIVVSERIALLANRLGWNNIKIADNADNISLLAALK